MIYNVPQSSSAFQPRSHSQRPGIFSKASQRRAPISKWVKKADIEYPFEHGEVINYTLDGVSIHPVTTKIQASYLTQLPDRKVTLWDFTMRPMVTLKQDGTILQLLHNTNLIEKNEACTE
jgi:hypothetical protein